MNKCFALFIIFPFNNYNETTFHTHSHICIYYMTFNIYSMSKIKYLNAYTYIRICAVIIFIHATEKHLFKQSA